MQKKPTSTAKTPVARKRPTAPGTARPSGRAIAGRTQLRRVTGEERGGRLVWLIGGGIVVFVLLLLGIGYYNENIGPARDTAIVVGNQHVSMGYYRERLRAISVDTGDGTQQDAFSKESTTTDLIETEQVILHTAPALGVTVTEGDIAIAMAKSVRAGVKDGKIIDPALYLSLVRTQLQRDGLSLDQFREVGHAQALKDKVQEKFKADLPKQTLAIKGIELFFSSEDKGRAAQQRMEQGDSFSDVSSDLAATPADGRTQPVDWTPVPYRILPAPVDDVAGKLVPGQVSDLIKVDPPTPNGTAQWILLTLTDRDPSHDISDTQSTQIAQKKADAFLGDQKKALNVRSLVDGGRAIWAAQHTNLPATAKATATPKPVRPGSAPPGGPPAGGPPQLPGGQAGPQAPATAPSAPPPPNGPPVPSGTP